MKAISVIVFLITILVCCGNNRLSGNLSSVENRLQHKKVELKKDSLTYKIISNTNKTFGYDILKDGKVMIHQASIPGASGNNGFVNKNSAQKVALLVIRKIRKGEMPPTVTKEELKKLGVL